MSDENKKTFGDKVLEQVVKAAVSKDLNIEVGNDGITAHLKTPARKPVTQKTH